jgi:cystathionine beta-lyase/cystathionine gamma-synthase
MRERKHPNYDLSTIAIHGKRRRSGDNEPVVFPIYQTAIFSFKKVSDIEKYVAGDPDLFSYIRSANPTVKDLQEKLAMLEGGESALAVSSGSAATAVSILSIVRSGDEIIAIPYLYGGSFKFFLHFLKSQFDINVKYIEPGDVKRLSRIASRRTKIFFFETPTNPDFKIIDIEAVVREVRKLKKRGINVTTIVDNTFATPFNQRPVEMGIDVVIYSATKYLGGHNDLIAGAIIGSSDYIARAKEVMTLLGCCLDPNIAFMLSRSLKTLEVRVKKQSRSALEIAKFLEGHPAVERVYYPGLKSHPGHKIAKKQMRDFGGTLSFEIKGGYDMAIKFVESVKLCYNAVSLGGTETLVCIPYLTSHADMTDEEKNKLGLKKNLIRISVGLEDVRDIIADLKQALDKCM